GALRRPRDGVGGRIVGPKAGDAAAAEECPEVLQAGVSLDQVALARRRVVLPELGGDRLVPDPVRARQDRRAGRDGALAQLQEAARLGGRGLSLSGDASTLADRAAVLVVLRPPDARALAAPQFRSVEVAHQCPPPGSSPGARIGCSTAATSMSASNSATASRSSSRSSRTPLTR